MRIPMPCHSFWMPYEWPQRLLSVIFFSNPGIYFTWCLEKLLAHIIKFNDANLVMEVGLKISILDSDAYIELYILST